MKIKKAITHEFYNEELEMLDADVVIHEHILDKTKLNEREIMQAKRMYIFYKATSIAFLLIAFALLCVALVAICNEANNIYSKIIGVPSFLCCFCIVMNNMSGDMFDKYTALVNNFFADEVKAVEEQNAALEDKYNNSQEEHISERPLVDVIAELMTFPTEIVYPLLIKVIEKYQEKYGEEIVKRLGGYIVGEKND